MKCYIKQSVSLLLVIFIFGNCTNDKNNINHVQHEIIATLDKENIYLNQIDSIIGMQIYEQRLEALQMFASREILKKEAAKNKISLNQLVEEQINKKCKEVTKLDFDRYISQNDISLIDTGSIISYLKSSKQKERQYQYIDSLKQYYPLKVKLRPPFYNTIETSNLFSQNITSNKTTFKVYIVSDFSCTSCQKAEIELQKLYEKYNKEVNFKFVYFSDYINKSAIACEAAARQGKFKLMHDKIFENIEVLHQDSIYFHFARDMGMDIDIFYKDMNDDKILKQLMDNKNYLIANNIFTTPTFIVNKKILDHKYSIHYIEDVIIEELNKK